ncbi:MAG: hypothetical protein WC243_00840 [Patescibacteria group bacterium]
MDKLINEVDKVVKKAPPLPTNVREFLVKFAPWAAVITVVLSVPAFLALLGMGSYFGALGMRGYLYGGMSAWTILVLVFLGLDLVLRGLSIPGLFAKSAKGWNLYFYSILLYFVYAVLSRDIFGGLITTAISLYLAFQIREYFK